MDYVTQEEKDRLAAQLEELKAKRRVITDRIAEARAHGDLKENAEYHAAREEQGLNEAKIRQLEERLTTAQVLDPATIADDEVFVGSRVRVREEKSGKEFVYHLVGEATGTFDEEIIEVTSASPMGRALMHAKVGETIRVDLPKGLKRFEIIGFADDE